MNVKWYRKIFVENNILIVVPAIVVSIIIVIFAIVGLQEPKHSSIGEVNTMIENQHNLEDGLLALYNETPHTELSPLFVLNPFDVSPLTGLLMFETDTVKNYLIVVKGNTADADISYVTEKTMLHYIPVYGLYAGQNNVIEIHEYDETNETMGNQLLSLSIPTDDLDERVVQPTSITTTAEYFGDDLMLLTPALDSLPVAYDLHGDVRWYLNIPLAFTFDPLENGHFLIGTDRIISDPYYTTGLYEMDLTGKIYNEYYIEGGYHHDAYELPSGNFLVLTSDFEGTVEDKIVELDRTTGEEVKAWSLKDYLNQVDGMSQMWTATDWFHNNSIDYDETTGDMILSGRHQDVVVSINYNTNELNWILGNPVGWDADTVTNYFLTPIGEEFGWQYAQHSAIYIDSTTIFIFDNGNNKAKETENYVDVNDTYSRGVIYSIDEANKTIEEIYSYGEDRGTDFYSPYISNVFMYEANNYLIHSGGIGTASDEGVLNYPAPLYSGEGTLEMSSITVEVLDDVVMYELIVPNNFYRAIRINVADYATNFNLNPGQTKGTQAETKQTTESIKRSINILSTLPDKYELTLVKESDRLVVEGVFNRNLEIYLVLKGDDETRRYNIPTSRTPYTAMCIGVFQGDDRLLTYYVNEANISGMYRVYLIIDGKEYETYKQVLFK